MLNTSAGNTHSSIPQCTILTISSNAQLQFYCNSESFGNISTIERRIYQTIGHNIYSICLTSHIFKEKRGSIPQLSLFFLRDYYTISGQTSGMLLRELTKT